MDDLFDAFDSSSSATQLTAALAGSAKPAGAGAAAAGAAVVLPPGAGRKRTRPEEDAASASSSSSSSSSAPSAAATSAPGPSPLGLHHGARGLDAIDAAATLNLDARRNERMVDFAVHAPTDGGAGAGARRGMDDDSDEEDEDGDAGGAPRHRAAAAKAGVASSNARRAGAGAGAGASSSSSSSAAAAASDDDDDEEDDDGDLPITGASRSASSRAGSGSAAAAAAAAAGARPAPPLKTSAVEIGEALRPRLTRGEIDESKSSAPASSSSSSGDGGAGASSSSRPPAKVYPFTLDPFQRRSIDCLERNESVLVSAHTSAGKTVVAEYAIAMALRDKQRVVYTSPIKALSNQKYRDLFEEFGDVGLMTGDVTINPNASCLVMTTEILRSMLYRGSEVMREVKWVIFDEIHYMRDRERGVVWEESIIMLPHKVRFVFLSATIPNAREFAEWVAKIHHQTCHVVYTDYRPTPLQHFIFPAGGDGVYLVVDEKGVFREDTFSKAMAALGSSSLEDAVDDVVTKGAGKKSRMKGNKGKGGPADLFKIVRMVMERHYDPVIVFSFSKRECENNALAIAKLDFTTEDEKKLIEHVFLNAIDSLSEDDKALPQIDAILPLLKRGIGIHHGGLLPILKEVIEILFQESLLKVLFATETFSMGINMPARTVVFTASRKWDGTDFRWISPGEYIQMSGRAGRRGLDDRGIVIQMIDEKMEPAAAKEILKGTADALNSAFHLGYNMLLNLQRMEGGDPERMMALSFHQFQAERAAPAMEAELVRLLEEAAAAGKDIEDEAAVGEYFQLCEAMDGVKGALRAIVTTPANALPFLQPGRLVRVQDGDADWGWGVLVDFTRQVSGVGALGGADGPGAGGLSGTGQNVVLRVLLHAAPEGAGGSGAGAAASAAASSSSSSSSASLARRALKPASAAEIAAGTSCFEVLPLLLPLVSAISTVRMHVPKDIRPRDARDAMAERIREVLRRFPQGPPLLDPVDDMQVEGPEVAALVSKSVALQAKLASHPIHAVPDRDARFAAYRAKLEVENRCRFLRERIRKARALAMRDTLRSMKRVLRRLGLVDGASHVVTVKGRVACEVNTCDELLATELIFNGVFNDLDAAQAGALLSCLVYNEKSAATSASAAADADGSKKGGGGGLVRPELEAPLRALQDGARRIAQVSTDCRLELDADEYVEKFNPGMMDLVYDWIGGSRFVDICAMTKEFEGTVIRVIRRLEELTRQLADAARAVGDEALEAKFREASTKMRRDIIFAASLYL
jgi:ATP-dependent RNA helicase DOB1